MTDVKALEQEHVLQIYRRQPVVFERGDGMRLFDDKGRAYLDFVSGIGVASLGHAHPGLAKALAEQASTLMHTSNLYFHPLQGELAARLSMLTGLDLAFFCNSGTEAVEACLKFARRYWHTKGETSRTKFVAFTHSFHGRTMGSLSVTWDSHYRTPFEPLVPGVTFVDVNGPTVEGAINVINASIGKDTAAVIVEPIQGEGGVRPISREVAAAISAACKRTGALVIADEVQTGSGRTGTLHPQPDARPRAGPHRARQGARRRRADRRGDAQPARRTRSGARRPRHDLRRQPAGVPGGARGSRRARGWTAGRDRAGFRRTSSPRFADWPRGTATPSSTCAAPACSRALELNRDATDVVAAALGKGLLVNRTATNVVRLLPPYIVTERDVDEAIGILDAVFSGS